MRTNVREMQQYKNKIEGQLVSKFIEILPK